jgi:Peptidase S46
MKTRALVLLALVASLGRPIGADEGMFPISDLARLPLRARGLKLPLTSVYNPGGASLVDAIVQVGRCTGSLVSAQGLVLTNHHCAFAPVQAASSAANDYVTNGFFADSVEKELPAKGITAQIAESYQDVSARVLAAVTAELSPVDRGRAIDRQMKAIAVETEARHPGKRAEVAEMAPGRSYVLFVYAIFRDVRVVYVPPRAIGEFGGEDDNWMWPRHTGDFSFLRVYVGPDGTPAEYNTANVPYRPRTFLRVNPTGASEGDFVFIFGYPGRTFRHRSSHYLAFEQELRLPYVADALERQIGIMERAGQRDRTTALKFDARIKTLANVMKNFRGKIAGVRRTSLIARRQAEEADLQKFVDADPNRKGRYGTVLNEIADVYRDARTLAMRELWLETVWNPSSSASTVLGAALTLHMSSLERAKPDVDRDTRFMDRNLAQTRATLLQSLNDYDAATDRQLLADRLAAALALPSEQRIAGLDTWLAGRSLDAALDAAYANTRLGSAETVQTLIDRPADALAQVDDPFLDLARAIYPAFDAMREARTRRDGTLSRLWPALVEMKAARGTSTFVPDANRTLRLTYGRVKGYSPRDGLVARPFTTVSGVVEKSSDATPFYATPPALLDAVKARDFGRFAAPALGTVPVAMIYDTDTTGGNSGSAVLNAKGEVVAVNFDRVWEATINDFAWSADYSRSIGVDVRYVLWVTDKVGHATRVLAELGVGAQGRMPPAPSAATMQR